MFCDPGAQSVWWLNSVSPQQAHVPWAGGATLLGSHLPSLEEIFHLETSQENSDKVGPASPLQGDKNASVQKGRKGKKGVLSVHTRVDLLQPWGAGGDSIPWVRMWCPMSLGSS